MRRLLRSPPQASRSPSQHRRLRRPGPPRPPCASTSSGSRPGETKIAYLLTATAQPGAAFLVVDSSGDIAFSGLAGAKPRSLEQALRRRPAARPQRSHNARHVPHRGRGAADGDLSPVSRRRRGRALPRPGRRHRLLLPGPARRRRRRPRPAPAQAGAPQRSRAELVRLAALRERRQRRDRRQRAHPARRPTRGSRGRVAGRRRLHQVHAHDRLCRHAAVRIERALGGSSPRDARSRGPLRAALAGQGLGSQRRRARPPGRHRLGQQGGHVQRRSRRLAPARARRRAHRRGQPLPDAAPGVPRQRSRHPAPAQPRRPRERSLRARRAARRRAATPRGPGASSRSPRGIFARGARRAT